MKKYVRAEMEIDKFEENSGILTASSCRCYTFFDDGSYCKWPVFAADIDGCPLCEWD